MSSAGVFFHFLGLDQPEFKFPPGFQLDGIQDQAAEERNDGSQQHKAAGDQRGEMLHKTGFDIGDQYHRNEETHRNRRHNRRQNGKEEQGLKILA